MKQFVLKGAFTKAFALVALSLTLLCKTAIAGIDSYQIYLNGNLVMKQYVSQPLSISSLQLNKAGNTDVLVVYYSHCGVIGKGRSIAVKDENGTVLKEWKFADATDADNGMQIPVKEILQLQGKAANLSLYYSSQQLPAGRLLTAVSFVGKNTAYQPATGLLRRIMAPFFMG
jgi:hypothetical protein